MLADLLCALGFACSAVQPDVSGHTIMNLLDQTRGDAELIVPALGSLYETVDVTGQDDTQLLVDLGRGGKTLAYIKCLQASAPTSCSFLYQDDDVRRIEAFLSQTSQWTLQEVGAITQEGDGSLLTWTAENAEQEVVLMRIGTPEEPQANIIVRWRQ